MIYFLKDRRFIPLDEARNRPRMLMGLLSPESCFLVKTRRSAYKGLLEPE